MISGIGTDIVDISRVEKAIKSKRFLSRVYTARETQYCGGRTESYAGLFAAKEAVAKALGSGFLGFWPSDIEIDHDSSGQPTVRAYNKAALICSNNSITRIHVSISHTKTAAIACAVTERGTCNESCNERADEEA